MILIHGIGADLMYTIGIRCMTLTAISCGASYVPTTMIFLLLTTAILSIGNATPISEKLLDEIFKAEYEFVYYYDNASRWEELSPYNYWGGGNAQTGRYYRCETTAYIYNGQPYRYRFKPTAFTSELAQYRDSEGFICINQEYRVLNPNDNYALTGFYIMDHRYFSGTQEPFYYFDNSTGNFFFMQGDVRHDRSFWGWDAKMPGFWFHRLIRRYGTTTLQIPVCTATMRNITGKQTAVCTTT